MPRRRERAILRRLFEPLGYDGRAPPIPLDETHPRVGRRAATSIVTLTGTRSCSRTLLEHLFVLLPVLDDDKHYWVGRGRGRASCCDAAATWLAAPSRQGADHPPLPASRSPPDRRRPGSARRAGRVQPRRPRRPRRGRRRGRGGRSSERISLNDQRLDRRHGGCRRRRRTVGGRPRLRRGQAAPPCSCQGPRSTAVVGVDVSYRALEVAARRLRLDDMAPRQRERVELRQGGAHLPRPAARRASTSRLLVEVIEHLDPWRLDALERVVFAAASPSTVIVTTPNVEYNALFEGMAPGSTAPRGPPLRVDPRRVRGVVRAASRTRHGYTVTHSPIGPVDPRPRRTDPDGGVRR